jgi:cytochrome b561
MDYIIPSQEGDNIYYLRDCDASFQFFPVFFKSTNCSFTADHQACVNCAMLLIVLHCTAQLKHKTIDIYGCIVLKMVEPLLIEI